MMLCYLDRSFCDAPCANEDCSMAMTDSIGDDAEAFGLPVALSDFSEECYGYIPYEVALVESSSIPLVGNFDAS